MSYKKLQQAYAKSPLPALGVKLPRAGTQKGQVLLYLFEHQGTIVQKKTAEKVVAKRLKGQSKDLQSLRHLGKQDGYDIRQGGEYHQGRLLKRGEYVLVGLEASNPYWQLKRRESVDLDFSTLKKKYRNCCATCGAVEGAPHRHTNKIVFLEKGHMDPTSPMTNDNIIPQCSFCNQVAKDKWIFDKSGFAKYMTIAGLLSHSPLQKQQFLAALEKDLGL